MEVGRRLIQTYGVKAFAIYHVKSKIWPEWKNALKIRKNHVKRLKKTTSKSPFGFYVVVLLA